MIKLLCIVGPTVVGKSSIAIDVAKKINTEIISLDAYQIYQGMNIGTAKVSASEQNLVKHNLIDIISPSQNFSSILYKQKTDIEIARLESECKTPILVGGTGFYLRSVLYPMDFEGANTNIRDELKLYLNNFGKQALHDKLASIDKVSATKLEVNDTKRVMRAIEIFLTTGQKKSNGLNLKTEIYPNIIFCLNLERAELYERINNRVDNMIKIGLIDEVENLLKSVDRNAQSMQAIGYKEIVSYLNNEFSLDECINLIKQHTRNYAKRQLTYFKTQLNVVWINANRSKNEIVDEIILKYNEK